MKAYSLIVLIKSSIIIIAKSPSKVPAKINVPAVIIQYTGVYSTSTPSFEPN